VEFGISCGDAADVSSISLVPVFQERLMSLPERLAGNSLVPSSISTTGFSPSRSQARAARHSVGIVGI